MKRRNIVRIDAGRCKGCELCVRFCPAEVLGMSDAISAKGTHTAGVVHPERCTGCRQCMLVCPDLAVEVTREGE